MRKPNFIPKKHKWVLVSAPPTAVESQFFKCYMHTKNDAWKHRKKPILPTDKFFEI